MPKVATKCLSAAFLAHVALIAPSCSGSADPGNARDDIGTLVAVSDLKNHVARIYVGSPRRGRFRELARDTSGDPVWSRDGSMLAYAQARQPRRRTCRECADIYVSAPDGGSRLRLTRDGDNAFPSWSADGRRIAFDRCKDPNSGPCGIYVVSTNGGPPRRVTPANVDGVVPQWSPDGSEIVFHTTHGIFLIRPDGGGLRRVGGSQDTAPSWSPDGSQIAFERRVQFGKNNPATQIYVMRADGTKIRRLDAGLKGRLSMFGQAWAPDGKQIAFVGVRETAGCSPVAIYRSALDGRRAKRLTPYGAGYGGPSWSPDGRHIAFVKEPRCSSLGDARLALIGAAGGEPRLLDPPALSGELGPPQWQPSPGGR
jgi:Tol biopolymer transport system component